MLTFPRPARPRVTATHDVARLRERRRQARLRRVALVLGALAAWMWVRLLQGDPVGLPTMPDVDPLYLMSGSFFLVLLLVMVGSSVAAGRSPHVVYRPEQIDVRLSDVKGLGPVTEDVRRSIDLLLAGRTFRREMGGTPRRGLLFEGPPGTGKTHLAKAMAAEAGVPFLFVSATSFQSMYYGATSRKIRSYFAALRKAARTEGAAIGFIEEIDAIATSRGGLSMTAAPTTSGSVGMRLAHCGGLTGLPMTPAFSASPPFSGSPAGFGSNGTVVQRAAVSEGVGGVVNELLVQMQSFDALTGWQRVQGALIDAANLFLPEHRLNPRPRPEPVDVLLTAAGPVRPSAGVLRA